MFQTSKGKLCNNPVLSMDISTGITFRVSQLFLECFFTSSKETMPFCYAVSRNWESLFVATKLLLEERNCYQAVAEIEGFAVCGLMEM